MPKKAELHELIEKLPDSEDSATKLCTRLFISSWSFCLRGSEPFQPWRGHPETPGRRNTASRS